jgi:ABC-type antimicrobial peptide transport system permease subunit
MTLIVRCESPASVAATVRQELRSLDPDVAAFRIGTYEEFLGDSLLIRRAAMLLVCGFGVTSLFLAGVGIYGLLSYAVSLRMKEFGVRSALGALPRHLISLVVGSTIRLLLFGAIWGAILSAMAARITAALLTELPRLNSATFAASLVLLALVVLCACALPARMAAKADPASTLRGD